MTTNPAPAPATATVRPRGRRAGRRRSEWPGRIATLLGLLLGIVIIVFPVAGTYFNNYKAYQFAQEQAARRTGSPNAEADNARMLAAARAYNAALSPTLLQDPWGGGNAENTPAYKAYEHLLGGPRSAIATLRLPTIKSELPIMHGSTEWSLSQGGGHMYGTTLPVGGSGTHAGLAAHRGLPNLTGFDRLPELKRGDQFFVDVAGQTLAYEVSGIRTVLPNDVTHLKRVAGKDLVTLITCTPYGINTHRLLVTGSRIPWSKVDKQAAAWHGFDWTIQSWMYLRLGMAAAVLLLILGLIVWWILDDRRRARRRAAKLRAKQAAALAAADSPTASSTATGAVTKEQP